MSAEEILIWHDGYTDTAYPSCGSRRCTVAILESCGVNMGDMEPEDVNEIYVDKDTHVTCAVLGESDNCERCACCGDFIQHGIKYPGEDVGCQHDEDTDDRDLDLGKPHIDLDGAAPILAYWGGGISPDLA